jgi:hypothetical protein
MLVVAGVRADGVRNCLAVAECLRRWEDWHSGLSRPTWDVIAEQTALSTRTVARWLRWLQDHGFLVLVQGGTTSLYTPQLQGNLAAVYQLVRPAVDGSVTPSWLVNRSVTPTRASKITSAARVTDHPPAVTPGGHKHTQERPAGWDDDWLPGRRALRREWRLQQARLLQEHVPTARGLSDTWVASIIRPYLNAGFTVEDLHYALDHRPNGSPHLYTDAVRAPASWLRWRLACWRGPDGTVLPSRRQQLLAQADAHRRQCETDLDVIHCRAAMEA